MRILDMRNICFQTNRNNRIRQKIFHVLRKIQTLRVNNSINLRTQNAKFSGYYFYMKTSIWRDFQIYISVPLSSNPANISCFLRRLQDLFKTSSRRLQDIFKTCLQDVLQLYLQDVFKTSWKTNKCYTEDVLKTSSRCLQYVFTKTNVCWEELVHWSKLKSKCF